ncbi:MAG TPA: ABC transporter permease [Clostridiaceae bacterium]|nr:ABC transporter permease [Clostridiaceae bacterium]
MTQNNLSKKRQKFSVSQYSYVFIFIALFIVYYLVSGSLKWTGVTNILRHSAVVGIISIGMGLIIITGEIDLSVGAILGCVASFGCVFFNVLNTNGLPAWLIFFLTVLFCLVGGTLLGFFNGILVGRVKLPAFIVTLATQLIYRSVSQYASRALSKDLTGASANTYSMVRVEVTSGMCARDAMYAFGNSKIPGVEIPTVGLIFILTAAVLVYVSTSTKYGKRLYAIGSNAKAAHMGGVNVEWNRVSVFTLAGFLCGVAAAMWLCLQGNVDPATTGVTNEMFAIAAVVLGGVAMSGGKGQLVGVIFGALSYTVIDKIITALKVDSLINNTIKGIILLIAIVIQVLGPQFRTKKKSSN